MSTRRSTWGQALKEAAIRFAREAERFVGANDAAPCGDSLCKHPRSEHCGCGMHCFGTTDGGTASCECHGFVPKPEQAEG